MGRSQREPGVGMSRREGKSPHGGHYRYAALGCRCDECVVAHRIRTAENRRRRRESGNLNHGTRSAYDAGCRCDQCREARRRPPVPRGAGWAAPTLRTAPCHYVYAWLDPANDGVLYVGVTCNPTLRITNQRKVESAWWTPDLEFALVSVHADRPSALFAEGCAIRELNPPHNVYHTGSVRADDIGISA